MAQYRPDWAAPDSSLHKRGYRVHQGPAPLSEVLAAGMLKISGWDCKTSLIDPFCGSGTLLTEAALMSGNIAPGIFRKYFGFQKWRDFDKTLWDQLISDARGKEQSDLIPSLTGIDIERKAVGFARENLMEIGLSDKVKLVNSSFFDFRPQGDGPFFLITNPPYGERIMPRDLFELNKEIGNALKRYYPGSVAWLLSGSREAEKSIGLKPAKRIPLWNGPIECKFLKFEMYQGSKKMSSGNQSFNQ